MRAFTEQRVTVVGLGREGAVVARVLAREGAHVTVTDTRDAATLADAMASLEGLDIRYSLAGHRAEDVLDCEMLVLSPGVDKRLPLVQEALRRGIAISSETELFLARCPARVIGITGSSGKTTTTTLVGDMLRRGAAPGGRHSVFVGGNIGRPLLEGLDKMTPDTWVVLELSSFQLEWLHRSPQFAAVTNITPNHLDRHDTMEAYVAAKSNIVVHQCPGDVAVLNCDDPNTAALAERTPARVLYFSLSRSVAHGAFLDGDSLTLVRDGRCTALCRAADVPVPGRHNLANALAAAAVAGACGISCEAIGDAIREFGGVPHRLQPIETIAGVTYYDDSIATAPERTLAALQALGQPLVLILGGRDKKLPWDDLAREAATRCRGIVLMGEAAPLIRHHMEAALADADIVGRRLHAERLVEETTMAGAVRRAASIALPGDAVVLSPGGTSYDMYRDFEQRGNDFAREVRQLGRQQRHE